MSELHTQHPADERLLDAALEQALAAEVNDSAVAVETQGLQVPPLAGSSARWQWSHAATFFLGLVITGLVFWQARSDGVVPAQGPVDYGVVVRAEGREEIEALPVDVTNLTCGVLKVEDLQLLARFQSLRRLQVSALDLKIGKVNLKTKHKSWSEAPNALQPLVKLAALESLTLPMRVDITAKHLIPLQGCAKLRELTVMGDRVPFTESFVDGLKKLPHLRSLQVNLVPIDATVLARLRALELEELHLLRIEGLDAEGFAEVCAMPTLRRISFQGLGTRNLFSKVKGARFWFPTAADLRKLAQLPKLEHLKFHSCAITKNELLALPKGLQSLELTATELLAEDYPTLERFGSLRRLKVRTARQTFTLMPRDTRKQSEAAADSIAATLGSLPLDYLHFFGIVTEPVLKQIASHPSLSELTLMATGLPDLSELANAPRLRSLTLFETRRPAKLKLDGLRALSKSASLTALEIGGTTSLPAADVRRAVGDKVRVKMIPFRW